MADAADSRRARQFRNLQLVIANNISTNLTKLTLHLHGLIIGQIDTSINQIRNYLNDDNVRVRQDPRLEQPPYRNPANPTIQEYLNRLANTVRVLRLLANMVSMQGQIATLEETLALDESQRILQLLDDYVNQGFDLS